MSACAAEAVVFFHHGIGYSVASFGCWLIQTAATEMAVNACFRNKHPDIFLDRNCLFAFLARLLTCGLVDLKKAGERVAMSVARSGSQRSISLVFFLIGRL